MSHRLTKTLLFAVVRTFLLGLILPAASPVQAQGSVPARCAGLEPEDCFAMVQSILPALETPPLYEGQRALLQYMIGEKTFEAWVIRDGLIYHLAVIALDEETFVMSAVYNAQEFEIAVFAYPAAAQSDANLANTSWSER